MKRLFLILSCVSLLISCDVNIYTGDNEDDVPTIDGKPAEPIFERADLYGKWKITKAKFAEDATMTEWEYEATYATFKENGLYESEGYWGDGEGTYSVVGNTITAFVANSPYITYDVISLTGTKAEIKATIVSTSQKIWMACEKVEIIEIIPGGNIGEDTMFTTFDKAKSAVAGAYAYLRDYMLYHHYIEYNALNNNRIYLTPNSEMISNAWANGYKVIRMTNSALKALPSDTTLDWAKECIRHFRAIRAFTYYNMVTLWGDIPYWTENDDPMESMKLPRSKAEDIINAEISSLSDIAFNAKILDWGNSALTIESAKLLLTEMYLYLNNQQKAKALLSEVGKGDNDASVFFAVSLDNFTPSGDNYFNSYKNEICVESGSALDIYTTASLELYAVEANNELTDLPDLWANNKASQYGYWPMLNRIGKTTEIIGCSKDETLMPIPGKEMISNPNIFQNPGY